MRVSLSSNPRVDAQLLRKAGFGSLQIIKPPFPIYLAELALERLSARGSQLNPASFYRMAAKVLQSLGFRQRLTLERFAPAELCPPEPLQFPELTGLLSGRILLGTELPELIAAQGLALPWDLEDWMQYLYFHASIRREAAVTVDRLGMPFCRRCGATAGIVEDDCFFCGNAHCHTCTQCRSMGIAKSCSPLYSQPLVTDSAPEGRIRPQLNFELTPPQQRASSALEAFLDGPGRHFLVWAVCGGGKTEVSFAAVAKVLSAGGRVLFAVPRKDIVQELEPRFQDAFPGQALVALYGGSGGKYEDPALVLATTHQCLRFYQAFDLVILDEADAFPYFGSEMLRLAVERALKPSGKLMMMTATPDPALLDSVHKGEIPLVTIPARPHRRPLIVPRFVRTSLGPVGRGAWQPPDFLRELLRNVHADHRRLLIFLPTVREVETARPALCGWAKSLGLTGKYLHAGTPDRQQFKAALSIGAADFLVVTTVFERGITIPDLDVVVLNADAEGVFDCRTLVQIAGRAGRRGEPAQVIFAGRRENRAMRAAVDWITEMNRAGYDQGYLDELN